MGWETGITLGAAGIQSMVGISNAKAQTKAIAQTAENQADNLANKTSRNIGALETSFLKGGISLDGVGGTQAVFQQAGQQGMTDIHRTIDNANASIADTMNKARSASLETIAKAYGKVDFNNVGDSIDKLYDGSALQDAWNGLGQDVGSWLDPSPTGPYQAFGV